MAASEVGDEVEVGGGEEGIILTPRRTDLRPAAFVAGGEALDDATAPVQTEAIGRVLGPQRLPRWRAGAGAERVGAEASSIRD